MAIDPAGQRDSLGALSQFFINDGTLGDTLLRVAELARDVVGPADMAGLTLLADGRPSTGVFTDPGVPDIDAAQYRTGRGPCLAAFADQQACRIDATAEDGRWPEFCQAAAARGVVATLSVPVT